MPALFNNESVLWENYEILIFNINQIQINVKKIIPTIYAKHFKPVIFKSVNFPTPKHSELLVIFIDLFINRIKTI